LATYKKIDIIIIIRIVLSVYNKEFIMLYKEDYDNDIEGKYVYCNNCQWLSKMKPFGESKHWQSESVVDLEYIKKHWPVACDSEELYLEIKSKLEIKDTNIDTDIKVLPLKMIEDLILRSYHSSDPGFPFRIIEPYESIKYDEVKILLNKFGYDIIRK
jgi:hypothetical protein